MSKSIYSMIILLWFDDCTFCAVRMLCCAVWARVCARLLTVWNLTLLSLIISVGYVNAEPFPSNCSKRVRVYSSQWGWYYFGSEDLPFWLQEKYATQNKIVGSLTECANAIWTKEVKSNGKTGQHESTDHRNHSRN